MSVDKTLLRQAAERVRDAAPGTPTLEALRHLQACFGWETVLNLLDEAEAPAPKLSDAQRRMLDELSEPMAQFQTHWWFDSRPKQRTLDVLVRLGLATRKVSTTAAGVVGYRLTPRGQEAL